MKELGAEHAYEQLLIECTALYVLRQKYFPILVHLVADFDHGSRLGHTMEDMRSCELKYVMEWSTNQAALMTTIQEPRHHLRTVASERSTCILITAV